MCAVPKARAEDRLRTQTTSDSGAERAPDLVQTHASTGQIWTGAAPDSGHYLGRSGADGGVGMGWDVNASPHCPEPPSFLIIT